MNHLALAMKLKNMMLNSKKTILLIGVLFIFLSGQAQTSHPGALNIAVGAKFETWLGTILPPQESFYLVAENEESLEKLLEKTAKIGYEKSIKAALISPSTATKEEPELDMGHFKSHKQDYQILDVRNKAELEGGKIFEHAISIPLPELAERMNEIDSNRQLVVHCASGYRSAIASSLIKKKLPETKVYDLGAEVKKFKSN